MQCLARQGVHTLGPTQSIQGRHLFSPSRRKPPCHGGIVIRCRGGGVDDDEFRSSRNIALSLRRRFWHVCHPTESSNGYQSALREFVKAGVTAYSLGCSEEGLRSELQLLQPGVRGGVDLDGVGLQVGGGAGTRQLAVTLGGDWQGDDVEECLQWVVLVFVAITCTPKAVPRWSNFPPLSGQSLDQWKGFCTLIADAYFKRGMAWYPIKRLQMEQAISLGRMEEPSLVAERMRIVFTTLEVVSPQFPRMG